MANLLDRFRKEVTGSDNRLQDFLPKITSAGDFQKIYDINVIIASWNNILVTPRRTHLHDPEYGSDLHKMVFEPVDDQTVDAIKTEIEDRIQRYDDRARIESIEVRLISGRKGFEVDVYVDYGGDIGTLSLRFDDSTYSSTTGQQ
jgi:phage baseplate assembly protein W